MRVLLSKVVVDNLKANYIDINNVFVNSELKEEVYIKILKYFELAYPKLKLIPTNKLYLKVNRALYSLKQSPLNWL